MISGLTKRSRVKRQKATARLSFRVGAVEKVSKQISGRDAEKSDLIMRNNRQSHAWERSSDPQKPSPEPREGVFLQAR